VTDRSTPAQAYHGGPATFAFSEAYRKAAEKQIAKYPPGKQASAVKALLDLAMRQMEEETGARWLPRAAMDHVAAVLGMPPIRVYEVASFYSMFKTRPVGRYHLQVCTTTPAGCAGRTPCSPPAGAPQAACQTGPSARTGCSRSRRWSASAPA